MFKFLENSAMYTINYDSRLTTGFFFFNEKCSPLHSFFRLVFAITPTQCSANIIYRSN